MNTNRNNNICLYFLFRCSYTLATSLVSIWIVQNTFDLSCIRSVLPFVTNKYFTKAVRILRNAYLKALSNKKYIIDRRNFYVISFDSQQDGQGLTLHSLNELISQNPHRPRRSEQELSFKKQSKLQEREKYAKELNSDKLQQLEEELTSLKAQIQQFRSLQAREEFRSRNESQLNFWKNEE
ncbi:hypothetical protein GpartN1_g2808.t1 [Galdieria partita]|uniref:Uncharacterized protein n=1 Tax=Galdieria partita TaxID=83374 RepID=A0A9C7UPZ1_9RHOD|nr:hypothetical protein GpartN1_g2314.t1 [Galdieria partita]GJQ11017.1 hypothetical protein GpartN1_g2808.t1 [Galdieria partita]